MSAISVAWSDSRHSPARILQESMLAAQAQYGAGSSFSWADSDSDTTISLGGTLSGFLPEDRFDRQPLWSPDHSCCLVADLRLDNREDLARTLSLIHPADLADSAILMAAWLRWGPACLDHILGGFAFAVWTPSRQQLFAARDHIGDRPLFYHRSQHLFALASMPKGLLALPGVQSGFQQSRVADCLACTYPDQAASFFAGIHRLPPGHLLQVTPAGLECRRYWHATDAGPLRYKKDSDYAEAALEIFDRATQSRLRSTRPVGSFLSAGLDSSSVTASAAHLLAAQGQRLAAFTSVPRPGFNHLTQPWQLPSEGAAAAEVAALYPNIDHRLVDTTGLDLLGSMQAWIDAMDEPAFNVVNLLWIKAILDQARQRGIGVMLEGGFGNGTISYESRNLLRHFFRRMRWIKLGSTILSLRRHGDISFKSAARHSLAGVIPASWNRRLIPAEGIATLYSPIVHPELARAHNMAAKIREYRYPDVPDLIVEHARYFEFVDPGPLHAAAQALTGIDVRDPTADKRLVDFCFSIPLDQFLVGGHTRSLARRAMQGRLPQSTLQRYARGLQGADWYLILREAFPTLRHEIALQQQSPTARQTLDLPRLQGLLDAWPDSGYHTKQVSEIWHSALTRAISMGCFLRRYEAPASEPPSPPHGTTCSTLHAP